MTSFSAIFTATSAFIFLNKKDDKNNKKYSTGMAILYSLLVGVGMGLVVTLVGPEIFQLM